MKCSAMVSYTTANIGSSRQITWAMERRGIDVFMAEKSIDYGQSLSKAVEDAIRSSDVFVVLLSSISAGSPWVNAEIGFAKGAGKPIIPVALEPEPTMPTLLPDAKYIPFYDDPEGAMRSINHRACQQCQKLANQKLLNIIVAAAIFFFVLYYVRKFDC